MYLCSRSLRGMLPLGQGRCTSDLLDIILEGISTSLEEAACTIARRTGKQIKQVAQVSGRRVGRLNTRINIAHRLPASCWTIRIRGPPYILYIFGPAHIGPNHSKRTHHGSGIGFSRTHASLHVSFGMLKRFSSTMVIHMDAFTMSLGRVLGRTSS